MPSINTQEFFEIDDFDRNLANKMAKLDWKAYINRNQKKLKGYWSRWYGRELSSNELYRMASGSDDPLGNKKKNDKRVATLQKQTTRYQQKMLTFQKKKDSKNYRKYKGLYQSSNKKYKAVSKTVGKNLPNLMSELDRIKEYEAMLAGVGSAGGYNIPSIYGVS